MSEGFTKDTTLTKQEKDARKKNIQTSKKGSSKPTHKTNGKFNCENQRICIKGPTSKEREQKRQGMEFYKNNARKFPQTEGRT